MRTTVTIDDDLLQQAKARALATGGTLGSVVEEALRLLLAQHQAAVSRVDAVFPTYGRRGLRSGVDLEDKVALAELLDEPLTDARP